MSSKQKVRPSTRQRKLTPPSVGLTIGPSFLHSQVFRLASLGASAPTLDHRVRPSTECSRGDRPHGCRVVFGRVAQGGFFMLDRQVRGNSQGRPNSRQRQGAWCLVPGTCLFFALRSLWKRAKRPVMF